MQDKTSVKATLFSYNPVYSIPSFKQNFCHKNVIVNLQLLFFLRDLVSDMVWSGHNSTHHLQTHHFLMWKCELHVIMAGYKIPTYVLSMRECCIEGFLGEKHTYI